MKDLVPMHGLHACACMPFIFPFLMLMFLCDLCVFALGGDLGVQDQLGSVQREQNQVRIHPIYAWKCFVFIYWVLIDFY